VFVTGTSGNDYATVGYLAATGAQLWVRRYHGPAGSGGFATSVAASLRGERVFVTGGSDGSYATVAYRG
jgi:hypothetical protein